MGQAWKQQVLLLLIFRWLDLIRMATSNFKGGWEVWFSV